jgi:hypothetical protein
MEELGRIEAAGGYGPPGGGGYGGPPPGGGGYGGPPPGGGGYGGPPGGGYPPPPGGGYPPPPGGFGPPPPGYPPPGYGPAAPFGAPPPQGPRTHPLAIASFAAGLVSILACCCCGIGIAFGIGAIVCGVVAKSAASANPQMYKGSGLAVAGIIFGVLGALSSGTMLLPGVTWDDHLRSRFNR